jgi:hypothetical protein
MNSNISTNQGQNTDVDRMKPDPRKKTKKHLASLIDIASMPAEEARERL